jgi:hypothetical protein
MSNSINQDKPPRNIAVIDSFLKKTYRPTFNTFVNKSEEQIKEISVKIVTSNALELQRHWINTYNSVVRTKRLASDIYLT